MVRSSCVDCGSTDNLTSDNNCPGCGAHVLVIVKNEPVTIAETVIALIGIYFELTDPVFVPGALTSSNDIEFRFETKNKQLLTAFIIKTDATNEEKVIDALHRASRFTNYLTFKTGIFVYHKQGRKVVDGKVTDTTITGGISSAVTALKDIDLTNVDMINLISNTSKENLQLAHFATGQKALNDNNYAESIREFFLIIESSKIPERTKYLPLRNAVSHDELSNYNTVRDLNSNFGLSWSVGDSLDSTDPRVEDFLRKESKILRDIAWHHIKNSINV